MNTYVIVRIEGDNSEEAAQELVAEDLLRGDGLEAEYFTDMDSGYAQIHSIFDDRVREILVVSIEETISPDGQYRRSKVSYRIDKVDEEEIFLRDSTEPLSSYYSRISNHLLSLSGIHAKRVEENHTVVVGDLA